MISKMMNTRRFMLWTMAAAIILSPGCRKTVEVQASRPVAILMLPESAYVGEVVTMNAQGSYDNDGYIVEFVFRIGSGGPGHVTQSDLFHYTFYASGKHYIELSVIDNDRFKGSTGQFITILREGESPSDIVEDTVADILIDTAPDAEPDDVHPDWLADDLGPDGYDAGEDFLRDLFIEDVSPEDTFVGDIQDLTTEDTYLTDSFIKDTYVKDSFIKDTYVKDSYVKDSYVKDSYVADTFVMDTYVLDAILDQGIDIPQDIIADTFGCLDISGSYVLDLVCFGQHLISLTGTLTQVDCAVSGFTGNLEGTIDPSNNHLTVTSPLFEYTPIESCEGVVSGYAEFSLSCSGICTLAFAPTGN